MKTLISASTLREQREFLCLQLQQNRQVMAHALEPGDSDFPRSFSMRLITQKKIAVGLRIFRLISYGFSFLPLTKRRSENVHHIEHGKARS